MLPLRLLLVALVLVSIGGACGSNEGTPQPIATIEPTQPTSLPSPTLALPATFLVQPTPTLMPETTATAIPPPPLTAVPPTPAITPSAEPSPIPCAEPGRIELGEVQSIAAGETMRYRVYLPPCYGQDRRVYPAIYMFGGNIHDDAIWDTLGLDEAADSAINNGSIPPLIIVMPDNGWLANTTTSGPSSYEGFVLNDLIPHIEATYCAWPYRAGRAVGGLSRGGYWSLMMAFRRPDLFRSVGAHSPALIDSHAGPAEDPAITGVTNDLGELRIWIDLGDRDPYVVQAQPVHEALTAANVPHEWRINPGTHDEPYWRENLAGYLAWYSDGWRVARNTLPECAIFP